MRLRMLDVLLSQMGLEKRFGFAKTVFVSVFVLLLGLGVGTSMGVERAGTGGGRGGMGITGAPWLGWDMGRDHDGYLRMAFAWLGNWEGLC